MVLRPTNQSLAHDHRVVEESRNAGRDAGLLGWEDRGLADGKQPCHLENAETLFNVQG